VVRCELPSGRQCIWEHLRGKARAAGLKPREAKNGGLSLLCPVHGDTKHSLSISPATEVEQRRVIWCCHAGCPEMAVRDALIADCHVSPGCLPIPRNETAALLEAVLRELTAPTRDHSQKIVRVLSAALGYKEIPHGADLERLAVRSGVSRRSAFKAGGGRRKDNQ